MSIYITSNTTSAGTTSLAFLDRNLGGKGPGNIGSSGIYPLSSQISVGLQFAASNLGAYSNSTIFGVTSDSRYYKTVASINAIPVSPPLLLLNPKSVGAFSADELRAFGFQQSSELRSGTWTGRPGYASLVKMWARLDHVFTVGASMVNPAGLFAFYMAWKCVGVFMKSVGGRDKQDIVLMQVPNGGAQSMMDSTADGAAGLTVAGDHYLEASKNAFKSSNTYWLLPKKSKLVNGFVFPYFDGMLQPNNEYLFSIFTRYFLPCIGTSEDDVANLLTVLRPGFRSLYSTPQGMALAHMFFGIDLAVQTGGLLRPYITNQTYLGFGLVQANPTYKLFTGTSIRSQLSADEYSAAVEALDHHHIAITEIREWLESNNDGGVDIPEVEKLAASSRLLSKTIYEKFNLSATQKDELANLINRTSFNDTYMEPSTDNIITALQKMASNSWDWPEAPYYLKGGVLFADDIITRILASFGPRAPFINALGNDVMTFQLKPAPPANLEGEGSLRYLSFAIGSLVQASASYRRMLANTSLQLPAPRSGKNEWSNVKDRTIVGLKDPKFRALYDSIRLFAMSSSTSGPRGVKRTAEADDSSNKRKKDSEVAAIARMSSLM